jgi:hypothetical protein
MLKHVGVDRPGPVSIRSYTGNWELVRATVPYIRVGVKNFFGLDERTILLLSCLPSQVEFLTPPSTPWAMAALRFPRHRSDHITA